MKTSPELNIMPPSGLGNISSRNRAAEEFVGKPIPIRPDRPREGDDIFERRLYHFEYDKANKVLCTTFEGRFTLGDFLSSGVETRHHILEKNPVAGIWDFSEVTSFALSSPEVHQMAQTPPFYPPGIPRFVITPSDYMYGMFRMFQILGEANYPGLQVVRTGEEAFRILGIHGMKFERI